MIDNQLTRNNNIENKKIINQSKYTKLLASPKEHYLNKFSDCDVWQLINRKMIIHKQLERPNRTYVVYSDLHGSYEKFMHWLKSGMGLFRIAVSENLGKLYRKEILDCYEQLLYVSNRPLFDELDKLINNPHSEECKARYQAADFFNDSLHSTVSFKYIEVCQHLEKCGLTHKHILFDLLHILRGITKRDERRIIKTIPADFLENILKLFQGEEEEGYESLVDGISADENVFYVVTSLIVKMILQNMTDKHINLGDSYDRGECTDKLMLLYRIYFDGPNGKNPLHYIWGNHDILWMGAAIGNQAMIMTALRISMRYNNVDFLQRYGINLDKLKAYSHQHYQIVPWGDYAKKQKG